MNNNNELVIQPVIIDDQHKVNAGSGGDEKINAKSELERMVDLLPVEDQAKFYKYVSTAGLREDDYEYLDMFTKVYLHTMFREIPQSINNATKTLRSQDKVVEAIVKKVVETEVKKIKREVNAQFERLISAQDGISQKFEEGANLYMDAMKKAQDDIDAVIESKRAIIFEHTSKSLRKEVPAIVDQYMAKIFEQTEKDDTKTFVMVVLGVLVGSFITAILSKLF